MPPTKATKAKRHFNPGIWRVYILPTVASTALVATRAEINAGIDVTGEIAEYAGWQKQTAEIDVPNAAEKWTGKISGRQEGGDCSITYYAAPDQNDIRLTQNELDTPFVYFADGGDVPGRFARVFPTEIRTVAFQPSITNEAAKVMIQYSITDPPNLRALIPASA